ncbi:SusD/RagB family nutrient-binding outer membrane lipoprotein [Chryseobacterium koreense]
MKNFFKQTIMMSFVGCFMISCNDSRFAELNTSKDLVTAPTLDYVIPTVELTLLERSYYTHYTALGRLSQQIHTPSTNDYKSPSTETGYLFDNLYPNTIKNATDIVLRTSNNPELVNYWATAVILKAYAISRVTDAYGDVPYSEAGLGYDQQIFSPKYDTQEEIYTKLCENIAGAIAKFDATKKVIPTTSDIVYKGNIDKWKRFGNSLILRYAMRMAKANPAKAQAFAQKALQDGLMQNNSDSFVVYYLPNTYYATTANGNAAAIKYDYKLTDVFVNLLKDSNDPRLSVYAMLPNGNTAPEVQKGYKLFESDNTPKPTVSTTNHSTYGRYDSPYVHIGYAETRFLLAEAALRGWISGSAESYFRDGVKANLQLQAIYGPKGVIDPAKIDSFTASLPFNASNFNEAFKAIHTQMWIMLYYNWNEAFANWRRTNVPNFGDAVNNNIARRLVYPQSEWNTNTENVRAAANNMGGDHAMTKVWWDK